MRQLEDVSRTLTRQVIDGLDAIVVVLDREGRVRLFNRAAERTSGYGREEVIGRSLLGLLVQDEERATAQAIQDRLFTTPTRLRVESHWVTKTNERRRIRWTAASLEGEQDELLGAVGIGIDVTRHQELQREVVEIDERLRQRFGQELHDMLASHLAGVAMLAAAMARKVEKREAAEPEELQNVTGLLYEAMEQVRVLSHSFASFALQAKDLAEALDRLAERTEAATGVRVTCAVTEAARARLPDEQTATHLYRIAQEAVHNAVKHGKPSQITLSFALEAGDGDEQALVLTIQDDGRGIPEAVTSGVGMKSMHRRANRAGATLRVERLPEDGTLVRCTLPLSKRHPDDAASDA